MKAKPTEAEAAAIAAAAIAYAAPGPHVPEAQAPSGWLEAARREAVVPDIRATWRA